MGPTRPNHVGKICVKTCKIYVGYLCGSTVGLGSMWVKVEANTGQTQVLSAEHRCLFESEIWQNTDDSH